MSAAVSDPNMEDLYSPLHIPNHQGELIEFRNLRPGCFVLVNGEILYYEADLAEYDAARLNIARNNGMYAIYKKRTDITEYIAGEEELRRVYLESPQVRSLVEVYRQPPTRMLLPQYIIERPY